MLGPGLLRIFHWISSCICRGTNLIILKGREGSRENGRRAVAAQGVI